MLQFDVMPRPALTLGLAGLLPFWGLVIALPLVGPDLREFAHRGLIAYGAVILAFLGGLHWGVAAVKTECQTWWRLGWGVSPSLLAWVALLLPGQFGLMTLCAGFFAAAIVDFRTFSSNNAAPWFGRLRLILSLGVIAALSAAMALGADF